MAWPFDLFSGTPYWPMATDHGDGGKHTVFDTMMDSDDPLPSGPLPTEGSRGERIKERKRWGVTAENFLGGSGLTGGRKE